MESESAVLVANSVPARWYEAAIGIGVIPLIIVEILALGGLGLTALVADAPAWLIATCVVGAVVVAAAAVGMPHGRLPGQTRLAVHPGGLDLRSRGSEWRISWDEISDLTVTRSRWGRSDPRALLVRPVDPRNRPVRWLPPVLSRWPVSLEHLDRPGPEIIAAIQRASGGRYPGDG